MQTETKKFVQFFKSWVISTLAVMVAVEVVHGIHFSDPGLLPPVLTALMLGILNAFIRPDPCDLRAAAADLDARPVHAGHQCADALLRKLADAAVFSGGYFWRGHLGRIDHQSHLGRAQPADRQLECPDHGSTPSATG